MNFFKLKNININLYAITTYMLDGPIIHISAMSRTHDYSFNFSTNEEAQAEFKRLEAALNPNFTNEPSRDGLSHKEVIAACKNIGIDLSCPACAELFYTGNNTGYHNHVTDPSRTASLIQPSKQQKYEHKLEELVKQKQFQAAHRLIDEYWNEEPTKTTDYYFDQRECPNCGKETKQHCRNPHERDSSGDYQECTICHWYKQGHGEWTAPFRHR